jgi:hypothetical protein
VPRGRNQIGLFTLKLEEDRYAPIIYCCDCDRHCGGYRCAPDPPPIGAQGLPSGDQGAKTGAPTSMKEAAGRLKTDTGKTKDDVKAMDVNKAKQDVGQVNTDVQGLKESVKAMPGNPFGK